MCIFQKPWLFFWTYLQLCSFPVFPFETSFQICFNFSIQTVNLLSYRCDCMCVILSGVCIHVLLLCVGHFWAFILTGEGTTFKLTYPTSGVENEHVYIILSFSWSKYVFFIILLIGKVQYALWLVFVQGLISQNNLLNKISNKI